MHRILLSQSVMDFLNTKDEKFIKAFYKKIKGKNERYRLRIGKYRFMYEVLE
jgi:mRNA-degrading endonuclease RelE of RelBE toxin-antitoxin system